MYFPRYLGHLHLIESRLAELLVLIINMNLISSSSRRGSSGNNNSNNTEQEPPPEELTRTRTHDKVMRNIPSYEAQINSANLAETGKAFSALAPGYY